MSHWDAAPVDATHYGYEGDLWFGSFYKLEGGQIMAWVPGRSEEWTDADQEDLDLVMRVWHLERRP